SCTGPECTAPVGSLDRSAENGDGLQTVTIPALTEFTIFSGDLVEPGPVNEGGTWAAALARLHATWEDDVLAGSGDEVGSIRKLSPLRASLINFSFHVDCEQEPPQPDAVNGIEIEQQF